jgi:hypothetical protein
LAEDQQWPSCAYESALAINANGHIFVGADFVGGAGGVYRSTDYGDSWVEINHDMIQTDVSGVGDTSDVVTFLRVLILVAAFFDRQTTATAGCR